MKHAFEDSVEYVVPRIIDPRHGWFFRTLWLFPLYIAVTVLAPLFTDLYIRLQIETTVLSWHGWGPPAAGLGGALSILIVSVAAGMIAVEPPKFRRPGDPIASRRSKKPWWKSRAFLSKLLISGLMLFLSGGIASARYAQGLKALRAGRKAAYEQARADMFKAQDLLKTSAEAQVARKNLERGAQMVEKGREEAWPLMRRDGVEMQREARKVLEQLQKRVDDAVSEAQERMKASKATEAIPPEDVLQLVVGPTSTEIGWSEIFAVICFLLSIQSAKPIVRMTRAEYIAALQEADEEEQEDVEEPAVLPEQPAPVQQGAGLHVVDDFEEAEVLDEPEPQIHPTLFGVDYALLCEESREGLDAQLGTWRGLPLGPPQARRTKDGRGPVVIWPTLGITTKNGQPIFIGSSRALRVVAASGSNTKSETESSSKGVAVVRKKSS